MELPTDHAAKPNLGVQHGLLPTGADLLNHGRIAQQEVEQFLAFLLVLVGEEVFAFQFRRGGPARFGRRLGQEVDVRLRGRGYVESNPQFRVVSQGLDWIRQKPPRRQIDRFHSVALGENHPAGAVLDEPLGQLGVVRKVYFQWSLPDAHGDLRLHQPGHDLPPFVRVGVGREVAQLGIRRGGAAERLAIALQELGVGQRRPEGRLGFIDGGRRALSERLWQHPEAEAAEQHRP